MALVGGNWNNGNNAGLFNWNNGNNAGLFNWNVNNSSSNTNINIGARPLDQIIHWCLMQQIESIIGRRMYYYCCASIPGGGNKGSHSFAFMRDSVWAVWVMEIFFKILIDKIN